MIGYLLRSIRDFTRLCRVALLRVFRRTALLCGTAQCSASLSPPPAALSFAYPEPASAGPGFKPPHQKKKPPFRTAFSFGGASGTLPGCAVSHCCASSAARHCSAALPNAPLRFLRHRRRSASHTLNPPRRAPASSRPIAKQKAALSDGFFLLVGHQGLEPGTRRL